MGTIWHETVIVTGSEYSCPAQKAREIALEIFDPEMVGPVISSKTNGYESFMVATSGSKLGWETYETHKANIAQLEQRLQDMQPYAPDVVVVRYGADWGDEPQIISHLFEKEG